MVDSAGHDVASTVETLEGTSRADVMRGSAGSDDLRGGGGRDEIHGMGGTTSSSSTAGPRAAAPDRLHPGQRSLGALGEGDSDEIALAGVR